MCHQMQFSQSWIHNFQNFSGAACPQTPLEDPQKFSSLHLKHFWRVRQISHSFLTLKLDRSVKYYGGQTEFISQKSIGKTIPQKHSLK